jgi:large subunit ribosomal protein L25
LEIIKLKTRPRTGTGKSYTRKARVDGWIPAIYYGHNREPVSIEVDNKEFAAIVRGRKLTHLVDLGVGKNQDDSIAVIREVQRHVVKTDRFLHIDFMHVAMNEKVTVEVPLVLEGLPLGVKDGGVLGHPVKNVRIECMPMDIPERVTIDVTNLNIGDSIHVRDVTVANIVIKESPDEVLAVVTLPTREAEVAKPEEAAAEGAAAPAAGGSASAPESK